MAHSFAYLFERFPSFVQTFVYREAAEMVRQQMAPWLVSIRRPDDPPEVAELGGIEVTYLPEPEQLRAGIDAQIAAGQLRRRERKAVAEWRKGADSTRVFEAVWLALRLREKGIRHIHAHFGGLAARTAWMLHDLHGFTYSFTGHANDIFCVSGYPISNESLVRDARLVVTETDYARRWMEEKYPFAKGKIFRVFNGMATTGFPARAPGNGPPRIVSVGRCVEKKGYADLIEACRLLHERGRQFECEIVGDGPLEKALGARIESANLSGVVRLLGARPHAKVRELLAGGHVFALASVPEAGGGSDNLPTVIAEAMLTGLPVVATHVAGIPEMVADGESGILVSPNNPTALAAALERLLSDPAAASRMGARGRELAVEKFAIENTVRELKALLVERCGVRPPKAARACDRRLQRGWFPRWSR